MQPKKGVKGNYGWYFNNQVTAIAASETGTVSKGHYNVTSESKREGHVVPMLLQYCTLCMC